eukprot:scaffold26148_cov61-Phaeocystis_antarctica.AAC.2
MLIPVAHGHKLGRGEPMADFHGRRGLRELSESTTGATTTFAGSGRGFKDDGVGTNAQFNLPRSLAIAPSGDFVLIARRTHLAHAPQPTPPPSKVVPAATHRAADLLLAQRVLAPDASQDASNNRIRRVDITTGATTTLAGSGSAGFKDDDVGTSAQFWSPLDVAIAPNGAFALVAVRDRPPAPHVTWPASASHTRPSAPAQSPSKVWCPPPHTAPPARSSLSVCSSPMHRRTMQTTASAVSTSAPERPPPSPAAA